MSKKYYVMLAKLNAHDELVAALRDLLDRFERICPDADGAIDDADFKRIRKVRAALAAADHKGE
jgi:hypothetical protein